MIHGMVCGLAVGTKITNNGASGRVVATDGGHVIVWSTRRRRVIDTLAAIPNRTAVCITGEVRETPAGLELVAEQAVALAALEAPAEPGGPSTLPTPRSPLLAPLRRLLSHIPQSVPWGGRLRSLFSPARKSE